ncbi:cytokine receptor family member B16 isoform X2 [Carcharodon carcharias]|uniref:cytokine receptor family member B16 isoform X2 n=1 Tax=Carcharodon carcharias TaxID=13397 RepID=UPI001B7F1FE5|nr:cytokine receptor family member B16 isoform X2 [Carcharodon carcharias]
MAKGKKNAIQNGFKTISESNGTCHVHIGLSGFNIRESEFERHHKKTWVAISECSDITETWCDITTDISSDVDYDLKVRSQLGNITSDWANLSKLFNRKETNLTTPRLTVKVNGALRSLDVSEVRNSINAQIYYWEKDADQQIVNTSMYQNPFNIILQRRVKYCFQAQLYISEYKKFSSRSDPICESVNDETTSSGILMMVTTVLALGVSILAVSLFLTWKLCCKVQSAWLPKVSAPRVPNFDNLRADVMKEEDCSKEFCDAVQVLPQLEPLLSQCQALTREDKSNYKTNTDSWAINSMISGNVSQSQCPMEIQYWRGYQSQQNSEFPKLASNGRYNTGLDKVPQGPEVLWCPA